MTIRATLCYTVGNGVVLGLQFSLHKTVIVNIIAVSLRMTHITTVSLCGVILFIEQLNHSVALSVLPHLVLWLTCCVLALI